LGSGSHIVMLMTICLHSVDTKTQLSSKTVFLAIQILILLVLPSYRYGYHGKGDEADVVLLDGVYGGFRTVPM
jgi:hypothetical protein